MAGRPPCIETKEQAERAMLSFCDHLAQGYPQYTWYIDEELVRCTDETLLKTIKEKPELFDTYLKDKAIREAYKLWWEKGQNMVEGKVKGSYSPVVYHTMMRNMFRRFGWWESENDVAKQTNSTDLGIDQLEGKSKDLVNDGK